MYTNSLYSLKKNQKIGRRSKETFLQRSTRMAHRHIKRCSWSLIFIEIAIKTIITLVPHASQNSHHPKKKKSTNNKCWRGCGQKGTLLHCWWECTLIQTLWRRVWRFLKKLKTEVPYDPVIPPMGIDQRKPLFKRDIFSLQHYLQ